jgi:PLD-like domain
MSALDDLEREYFPDIANVIRYSGNTELLPHVDGVDFFTAIHDAIAATEGPDDRVYIVNWLFERQTFLNDHKKLNDLLVQKADDLKVDVRVIVWSGRLVLGSKRVDPDVSHEEWWINRTAEALDLFSKEVNANIENCRALRAQRPAEDIVPPLEGRVLMDWAGDYGSRHQKYVVVYRKSTGDLRAFIGIDFSMNNRNRYQHPSNDSPHELGLELRGEAGRSVWQDFKTRWEEVKTLPTARYWNGEVVEPFNPTTDASLRVPPVPSPDTVFVSPISSTSGVRIVRSYDTIKDSMLLGPDLPWTTLPPTGLQEIFTVLQQAVPAARRYIYIEDQGINNSDSYTAHRLVWPLLSNRIKQGVKVICVTSGHEDRNTDLTPSIWDTFLNFIHPDLQPNFVMYRVDKMEIHSKVILIDDEFASVGSANFWDRSMDGADTELTAMAVDPSDFVKELRVRLWADHLRVNPNDATYRPQLLNLDQSLGIFRPGWGTGISPAPPNSKLQLIGPPHPDGDDND